MMRWVLLACLAAMAGATSDPRIGQVGTLGVLADDVGRNYAIFLANSSAHQTTTFTLLQSSIKITRHSAADALAVSTHRPKIIVTDAAAKGLVCVQRGRVEVTSSGKVVESSRSSVTHQEDIHVQNSGIASSGVVEVGVESHKSSEDLIVGQGGGVVASVSSAAAVSGSSASSAASSGGAAASSAASAGGAAASSAAGQGSAASSAAGEGSAASSAAGQGSAASSAAGQGSAASSAAGQGSAASSAAGEGSAASSASDDGSSSSSISSEGEVTVDVSGGGEAAAISGGESIHVSGSGHVTYVDERFCECVPDYLCADDGFINTSGTGLIDIRLFSGETKTRAYASKCKITETCCKHRDHERIGWTPTHCGERSPIRLDKRVVTGEVSGLGKNPWVVAIILANPGEDHQYVCGGSLVRENVVLTSAHCVHPHKDHHLIVRLGEWDTCNTDQLYPHVHVDVASVVEHEAFNPATLANDVALLTLTDSVESSTHINTICLPDAQHSIEIDYHNCVATGWGKESFENSQYSNILKEVPLEVVDHEQCQTALRTTRLGKWFKLHETFTCAGGRPHVDTCKGDGGSPLVCRIPADYEGDEKFVQVGIVAWGIGCGRAGIPGVYADVQNLLPWIQKHLPAEAELY